MSFLCERMNSRVSGVNLDLALEAEKLCIKHNVLPATVGVIDGKLTVSLLTDNSQICVNQIISFQTAPI